MTKSVVCVCGVVLLLALTSMAQSLDLPVAGTFLDGEGRLLAVPGVMGSLLPGAPVPSPGNEAIIGVASSASSVVIKTASKIVAMDAHGVVQLERSAPEGVALAAFTASGTWQWTYFQSTARMENLNGATLDASSWGDSVVALGVVESDRIALLVRTAARLWITTVALPTGSIISQTAIDGDAPCVFFENGWLRSGGQELIWDSVDGSKPRREISVPAPLATLQEAGAHSVAVNGHWLLDRSWQLLEVPAIPLHRLKPTADPPKGKLR